MRSGFGRLATLGLVALAVGAAGCGRGGEPDLVNGKTQFAQKCGSCHILERAGTQGIEGPNLDAAFGPARDDGLGEQTVAGVVERQIGNVRRNSTMPEDLVTGQDAHDVAAYVAAVAGQPGEDTGALASAGQPEVSNKPIVASAGRLQIDADPTGALAFASTRAIAPPGRTEFAMDNPAQIPHNIALRDAAGELVEEGNVVGNGGTSTFTADLTPGEFSFVCTVPGHEEGGMTGTLTVER